jgi:hypothetical protein
VRQSSNYQSAEATYGIEIPCDNNPKAIKAAQKQAEEFVENALVKKLKQQQQLLAGLGAANKG